MLALYTIDQQNKAAVTLNCSTLFIFPQGVMDSTLL